MKDTARKWQNFMTEIKWKGVNNWQIVDESFLLQEIPQVEAWARHSITYINDHDVRRAFKKFFWSDEVKSQYDYTRKNQAVYALMTLYAYQEQENVRNND